MIDMTTPLLSERLVTLLNKTDFSNVLIDDLIQQAKDQEAENAAIRAAAQVVADAGEQLRSEYMRVQSFAIAHLPTRFLDEFVYEYAPKRHTDQWNTALTALAEQGVTPTLKP